MTKLTRMQQRILDFVHGEVQSGRPAPTHREICQRFAFKSPRSATCHLQAIARKGYLQFETGRARTLQPVHPQRQQRSRIVDIPLYGSIPAGLPQTREQEAEGCVSVDIESIGFKSTKPLRNAFALRVQGDSMIGANICDGDIVIVEFGPDPRSGQIVAAYIDGASTLKTFVEVKGKPYLRAENPKYPKLIPAEELTIQGVFKALIRRAKD